MVHDGCNTTAEYGLKEMQMLMPLALDAADARTYLEKINVMAIKGFSQDLILHPLMANGPCDEVLMPLIGVRCKVGIVDGVLQTSIGLRRCPNACFGTA